MPWNPIKGDFSSFSKESFCGFDCSNLAYLASSADAHAYRFGAKSFATNKVTNWRKYHSGTSLRFIAEIFTKTIWQSFTSAMDLGASYVELGTLSHQQIEWLFAHSVDVQVTKDHVPVVYHDFLFMQISYEQSYQYQHTSSNDAKIEYRNKPMGRVGRSRSMTAVDYVQNEGYKIKHTFDYHSRG
ncbi:hypothetical protein OCU04_012471 [Sclerotinia nivalis]|uniref:Uncharacterized protein n=1 Tax=Sclerotinia nivalis TaxID=352851 RepID=A0A9X0DE63_9HELO|nr:hypothetical protein OCU04_012471 [Sclerotinia nivalis]